MQEVKGGIWLRGRKTQEHENEKTYIRTVRRGREKK